MSNSAALQKVIEQIILNIINDGVHTCTPGKILQYDSVKRKARVQPLIKKKYNDGTEIGYKPVEDVPVLFYGIGLAGLRLPEKEFKGKTVLLFCTDRAIDTWLVGTGKEVAPKSKRKYDISDCIAIVSLNTFSNTDSGGNNLELFYKDSIVRIREDGIIEIGVNDFKKIVTDAFADLFNNHVHSVSVAGTPAAQTGVTSSPSKLVGTIPVNVSAISTIVYTFNDDLDNNHMTSKVKVE